MNPAAPVTATVPFFGMGGIADLSGFVVADTRLRNGSVEVKARRCRNLTRAAHHLRVTTEHFQISAGRPLRVAASLAASITWKLRGNQPTETFNDNEEETSHWRHRHFSNARFGWDCHCPNWWHRSYRRRYLLTTRTTELPRRYGPARSGVQRSRLGLPW